MSKLVFTQRPSQRVFRAGHVQLPLTHTWPAPQRVPHVPQFCGSLLVLMQRPLHEESGGGHEHAPPRHAKVTGQA